MYYLIILFILFITLIPIIMYINIYRFTRDIEYNTRKIMEKIEKIV